jgi:hypothetical protein
MSEHLSLRLAVLGHERKQLKARGWATSMPPLLKIISLQIYKENIKNVYNASGVRYPEK